jgi:hypothetical protein
MRKEAARGCQFCILLLGPTKNVENEDATLVLRRNTAFPDRAIGLGTGNEIFFRRIPYWWSSQSNTRNACYVKLHLLTLS